MRYNRIFYFTAFFLFSASIFPQAPATDFNPTQKLQSPLSLHSADNFSAWPDPAVEFHQQYLNPGQLKLLKILEQKNYPNKKAHRKFSNDDKLISEYLCRTWDDSMSVWIAANRTEYTYSPEGFLESQTYATWNAVEWLPTIRFLATNNSSGNRILVLRQQWGGSDWLNVYQEENTYNSDQLVEERTASLWQNENWEFFEQHHFSYIQEFMISDTTRRWNASVNLWENHALSVTDYTLIDGNRIYSIRFNADSSGNWQPFSLANYEYDPLDGSTTILNQVWENGDWENRRRQVNRYDAQGNWLSALVQNWTNQAWVNNSLNESIYDASGFPIEQSLKLWENGQWVNSSRMLFTYNPESFLVETIRQQGQDSSGWVNDFRSLYQRDGAGHQTELLQQDWEAGQWKNVTKCNTSYQSLTAINDDAPGIRAYTLTQNYPNPFNPGTVIRYSVPANSSVRLTVYDITGRRVRTLIAENKAAGKYAVEWDGTNDAGRLVSSGLYFYRLSAGDFVKTRKMMLLR